MAGHVSYASTLTNHNTNLSSRYLVREYILFDWFDPHPEQIEIQQIRKHTTGHCPSRPEVSDRSCRRNSRKYSKSSQFLLVSLSNYSVSLIQRSHLIFYAIVEYHNLTPAEEREIFQRVQLGVSLTAAGMAFCLTCKYTIIERYYRKVAGYCISVG